MKTNQEKFSRHLLVVAIQSALLLGASTAAFADDEIDPVLAMTRPGNYVEVGMIYISDDSTKFGEYNGLADKGFYGSLDFLLSGGGFYDSEDASRWTITGTDLGLDSRELTAEVGVQGKYRLTFGYDELRHNQNEGYQTPYLGVGSDNLTLPGNWLQPRVPHVNATGVNFRGLSPAASQGPALINGVLTQPTAAQLAIMQDIVNSDVPAFRNVDLGTKRQRIDGGFSYQLTPAWSVKVSAQNENKDGLRAQNSVTNLVREFAAVLPEAVDSTTQQYNMSVNYVANQAHMEFSYYGSLYDNDVKSMTWQDINDLTKTSTMSTTPSNEFHQFNFTGGYRFAPQTNLVFNAGYATATQDDTFLNDPALPLGLPVTSLDGEVVTTSFNAKLTTRPTDGLNLIFGYKYDDRDNNTAVERYIFQDINEARASAASAFNAVLGLAPNTLGSNINIYENRPYSKTLNQFDASADYNIAPGHSLRAAYQYQQIERDCSGSWINCADAPKTEDNIGLIEWRATISNTVHSTMTYTYSDRSVNYDENAFLALVPMANFIPAGGATVSVFDYLMSTGLTGFGPYLGYPTTPLTGNAAIYSPNNSRVPQALYGSRNNVNELLGLRRFNMADRSRDKFRAKLDWQASEKVSVYGSFDYNQDDYSNSLYGLTGSEQWVFNIDAGYAISDTSAFNIFYTYDDRQTDSAGRGYGNNSNTAFVGRAENTVVSGGCFATVQARNNNAQIDPCLDWTSNSTDKVHTFGVGLAFKELMDGRMNFKADLVGTRARTNVDIGGGSYVNNPFAVANLAPISPAVFFVDAQNLPTVTTETIELRLNASWRLSDVSDLQMMYWYAHMNSADYMYDGLQFGSVGILMPTNEYSPDYNINGVGLTYNYHW